MAQHQIVVNTKATSKREDNGPKAIIIEPSRELAEQTYKCIETFKKYLPGQIKQLLVVGGGNSRELIEPLEAGVDIVVATPGKLEDLVNSGHLSLKSCR